MDLVATKMAVTMVDVVIAEAVDMAVAYVAALTQSGRGCTMIMDKATSMNTEAAATTTDAEEATTMAVSGETAATLMDLEEVVVIADNNRSEEAVVVQANHSGIAEQQQRVVDCTQEDIVTLLLVHAAFDHQGHDAHDGQRHDYADTSRCKEVIMKATMLRRSVLTYWDMSDE